MWNKLLPLAAVLTLTLTAPDSPGDADVVVIVNKGSSVSSLTKGQLDAIFKTRSQAFPSGGKATPVNLPTGNGTRTTFDQVVLSLKAADVERFWMDSKIRTGNGPPRKLASPSAVAAFVGGDATGIGYVPADAVKGNVKVVARIKGGSVTGP